jgi:hypothetical protein
MRDNRSVGRLLFQANYPLDAPEVDKSVVVLYSARESFIVAPAPGRETRAENNIKTYRRIQDRNRVFNRAAMTLFWCDNRTESVHINIQPQKEGAQAW